MKKKKGRQSNASQLASNNSKSNYAKMVDERNKERIRKENAKLQNKRPTQVPRELSENELQNWKSMLEPLQSEANQRIEMIKHAGYVSRALDRVMNEGGKDYFDLDVDVSNKDELIREMTRLRVFINDEGSTLEGAKLETTQIFAGDYKGKFGNEYNNEENKFAHFDTSVIDKDIASRAFATYRKIEEHRAGEITGDGSYGSENLIVALYDAEVRGLDSLMYGEEMLDTFILKESNEWKKATYESNMISAITGVIEDNITRGRNF